MSTDDAEIYVGNIHPDDKKIIETVTSSRNWDYQQFKLNLTLLAAVKQYIPAHNRPESIHLQGLRPSIEDLKSRTKATGKEYARVIFADPESQQNPRLILGKTTEGSSTQVRLDFTKPADVPKAKSVLTVHVHPLDSRPMANALGASEADFKNLLADPDQQGMLIEWGDYDFLILKTSATPNRLEPNSIEKRLKEAREDFLDSNGTSKAFIERARDFNKAVCSEFGMVLYIASPENRDLATRQSVVS